MSSLAREVLGLTWYWTPLCNFFRDVLPVPDARLLDDRFLPLLPTRSFEPPHEMLLLRVDPKSYSFNSLEYL